ncbi:hypothetical protein [Streptomyces eurythermus]
MTAPGPRPPRLLPVPAVALWSDQTVHVPQLRLGPEGVYSTGPEIRDADGLLWPQVFGPETGEPLYAVMDPLKQRRAMEEFRCQVGMGPATRTPLGVLWVLPLPRGTGEDPPRDWDKGVLTTEPPVCLAHARVAVRVQEAELYAVKGTFYPPPPIGARPFRTTRRLDDPEARLMVADLLVRRLKKATPIGLSDPDLARDAAPCNRPSREKTS